MNIPPGPFDHVKHSLKWTLTRLMEKDQDLEMLCKYVPRIANSVANVSRVEHAIKGMERPDTFEAIQQALQELIEERMLEEEES